MWSSHNANEASNLSDRVPLWEDHLQKPSTCPHATKHRSPLRGGMRQYILQWTHACPITIEKLLKHFPSHALGHRRQPWAF